MRYVVITEHPMNQPLKHNAGCIKHVEYHLDLIANGVDQCCTTSAKSCVLSPLAPHSVIQLRKKQGLMS